MFLTAADIIDRLPSTSTLHEVDDLLLGVQRDLLSLDMVFTTPVETTKIYQENKHYQAIFDLPFAQDITTIQLQDETGNTNQDFLLNTDYTLSRHAYLSSYYVMLRLRYGISPLTQLAITAKFGLFIDFTVESYESNLLKAIIVKFCIKQLQFKASGYQNITESRTGDSTVKIELNANRQYSPSILFDPEFTNDLNYFRL